MAAKKRTRSRKARVECRIVGFDRSIFAKSEIEGRTLAWRCRFCNRVFVGNPEGNGTGFSHDCSVSEHLFAETRTEDDSGDLGDA